MSLTQSPAAGQAADAQHITAVRSGDTSAYAALYERHRAAAYHLARQLVGSPSEADDLVSDAFVKVFQTLLAGGGPDSAFRAYLLTSVRNTFYDGVRRGKKVTYTDDMEAHDEGMPYVDPAIAQLDSSLAARAFARLPERWQTVLWHTEIDGESPAQVAPVLGMTANATAALAYRAREGLRQAFLQEHVADVADSACKLTSDRLGAWARGGLSKREQAQVDRHLDECDRCAAVAAEITDLGTGLRGVVAVLAIGSVPLTAAYLAGGTTAKIGALAWAGVGAPAAGFAQLSPLLSASTAPVAAGAAPAATATTTATTGAFVPESTTAAGEAAGAAGANGAGGAAASNSKGLLAAIAGTAAVAAIATAVIVGSSYDDPNPSATDGGSSPSTSASAAAPSGQPSNAHSSAASTSAAPASGSAYGDGSPSTYDNDDIDDLPAIPPVIGEVIPGSDPTIPALPSEAPAPAPEPGPTQNPGDDEQSDPGNDSDPTQEPGPTDNPGPTQDPGPTGPTAQPSQPAPPSSDPGDPGEPSDPGEPEPAETTATPSPLPPTPLTTSVTANVIDSSFTVTNPDGENHAAYQNVRLSMPAIGEAPGAGILPTTCQVLVNGIAVSGTPTPQPCRTQTLNVQLASSLDPGDAINVQVLITVGNDISTLNLDENEYLDVSLSYSAGAEPLPLKIGPLSNDMIPPSTEDPGISPEEDPEAVPGDDTDSGDDTGAGGNPQAGADDDQGDDGQGQDTP